jgi:hypothetical protein
MSANLLLHLAHCQRFPITGFKLFGEQLGLPLIFRIVCHTRKCSINLTSYVQRHVGLYG